MQLFKAINNFPGGWAIFSMIIACIFLWAIPFAFKGSSNTDDEITHVPGYEGPLPSKMYSGYIPTGNGTKMIHYWLIESENKPSTDPLVMWLQGGPGGSSMIGLFTEMGPLKVHDGSFDVKSFEPLKVFYNNYTWTKYSNMLFIESPAGVGYSYWVDGVNKQHTDETVADDTAEFLENFFNKYPSYRKNEFYITGESYAGIYIPTLSHRVLKMENINFAGVAVGNGCTGLKSEGGCGKDMSYWYVNKIWGHGQVSTEMYNEIMDKCTDVLKGDAVTTPECMQLMDEFKHQVGGYNVYHIYDECHGQNDDLQARYSSSGNGNFHTSPYSLTLQQKEVFKLANIGDHIYHGAVNNYPCGSQRALFSYLSDPRVAEALNCKIPKHSGPFQYLSTEESCFKYYNELIEANKRILIFYGDTDIIVPSNGGEFWTHNMGLEIIDPWRSWTPIEGSIWTAGHVVTFEKDFTFLTIKGAGHMAPTFKPEASFYMMKYWLDKVEFPQQFVNMSTWSAFISPTGMSNLNRFNKADFH